MDIKGFIENVAEQYDMSDVSSFDVTTKYKEKEDWTSLVALSIILMVDEEYDVIIDAKDIQGTSTIEELYNIISVR